MYATWHGGEGAIVHCLVHLLRREFPVNLLHGLAGLLHGRQRLPVDIRRFDRVDLLLQRSDLRDGLV